jgi:sulfoxide reductase heme-binding subunit YedZ
LKHLRLAIRPNAYAGRYMLMNLTVLDLSAYVGIAAVGTVTLNVVLGLLMAFRYSPHRSWPHRRFNYFRIHNWTGYIALATALLHPAILLFNKTPRFRVLDLIYPVHSPSQPLENTIGAIAIYALALVVVTSYFRLRLGRHLWKSFHFTIYFAAAALFFHGLFTDPSLKNAPVDWLDGEKLFIEFCVLLVVVITFLRHRHSRKKVLRLSQPSRRPAASTEPL